MKMRDKTRRRLLFLLVPILVLIALAGGAAALRLAYLRRVALQGRTDGLAAMARNDYPTALQQLGRYLSRNQNDADVLLPYAKARRNVEEPNHSNLGQAVALYQRVLELHPDLSEAQHDLLDLYVQIGFNTEAVTLADRILAQPSDSPPGKLANIKHAHRSKVIALMRMQRLDAAQAGLQQLAKEAPLDLEVRMLELQIILKKGPPEKVVAYANNLALQYPNDVRFQLLKSIAATLVGDATGAKNLVKPLVGGPQVDAVYTSLLVRQLDNLELFEDSFSVIQKATTGSPDPEIKRLWIRRLFETNRFPMLVEQTASLDAIANSADVETLAMRVWALAQIGRHDDARPIVAALDKRGQTEPAAAKWAAVLHATALNESPDPVKTAKLLRETLNSSPNNSILLQELGDAFASAGAHDKAMSAWRDVNRLASEWARPLVRISQAQIAAGRAPDALVTAQAAVQRSPLDRDTLVNLANATAANLPDGPSPGADKVLETIANLQKQFPGDEDLLSLRVRILAQARQLEAAREAIRTALSGHPVPPERALLSLAQLSEAFDLGQEDACWATSQKDYGLTVDLAFARAAWLRHHQRAPEGLTLIQQARAAHPATDVQWKRVWAEYLDVAGDPRAKDEWIALGDGNPTDIKLQWGAVAAQAAQADHAFVGRTIDRLVSLLGEDSMGLRLLRARWYLQGSFNEKDATQAAILLGEVSRSAPGMLAPRLLLATCYMKLGNITGAIEQLAAASDAQPDAAALAIEVARLLHGHGDFSRSRQYIDRACRSKLATVQVVRQAAGLLALQGDYPSALAILEKAYANDKQQPADLVLAALYRQLNQPEKTAEICRRLLEKPDPQSVAFAADFYASQGRPDEAKSALAQLDGLKLAPGISETIRANYTARYGTSDEAMKLFRAAAQATPKEPAAWQRFVNFCFAAGKTEEAVSVADEAAHSIPGFAGFDVIRQNATLIKDAGNLPGTRPLLMSLSDAAINAAILEALRDVVSATQHNEPAAQTATKLRQLADRNPRILAIQSITLEYYINTGQLDEAVRLATRTVQSFPAAVEPLRVETGLLGATKRWDEALGAAKEWRRRDSAETLDADLAIAGAQIQLGDISAANQQIQPYLDRAVQDPDKFSGVLLLRARGLLADHHPEQVESLLGPLLGKFERMRALWVSLASRGLDDPQLAKVWLERAATVTPDNASEKLNLANAWLIAGRRFARPDYQQTGTQLLASLAQAKDAAPEVQLSLGMACEGLADWKGAQEAYRRVLEQHPKDPIALNNLASVLVKSGGDLEVAQQLAARAIAVNPNIPAFLDTRAMVQSARKDYPGAIASLKEAQRLDPRNFEWRVNLLAAIKNSGQIPAAKAELRQIAAAFPSLTDVPAETRLRYESLREQLQ